MPILLLNPPSPTDLLPNREGTASFGAMSSGFLYPPHTLAVVLAVMREAGLDGALLDAVGEELSLEETVERVRAIQPELLGVYASWGTQEVDKQALQALRAAFPDMPIVAMGTGARYHGEALLAAGANHMLAGDPELAFAALAAGPLPDPGVVKANALLPEEHNFAGLIRHPQTLPRPAWDAVPWQAYGFLTLFGSRGCDDNCAYCAYVRAQGRSQRVRPPENVAEEMAWLERSFGPKRIMARDLVFAAQRAWALDVAEGLIARGFHTPWECESRPEHFDPGLLKKLARAGCTTIKIGIESGDPEELARIGRVAEERHARTYLAYLREVVAAAKGYGINVRAYVMVGLPGQTMANVQATAAYVRELRPTFFHPRPYVAYPRVLLGPGLSEEETERLRRPLLDVARDLSTEYARQHAPLRRAWRKLLLAIPD
ncbi:MAG TPA: radical SAM protein [Caldilineae bacterium]|nr:radical SAM protein [Caldilineae bacterium]